jgi:hypothetical protein
VISQKLAVSTNKKVLHNFSGIVALCATEQGQKPRSVAHRTSILKSRVFVFLKRCEEPIKKGKPLAWAFLSLNFIVYYK